MSQISLKTLMKPSMTVSLEFPGMQGWELDICYLAREELLTLRKKCLSKKFNRSTHQAEETLDEDKFLVEYVAAVIKGWKGLKLSYLEELLLVDTGDLDPDSELPFSQEEAEILMKNSTIFDTWITDTLADLENFTKNKSKNVSGLSKLASSSKETSA